MQTEAAGIARGELIKMQPKKELAQNEILKNQTNEQIGILKRCIALFQSYRSSYYHPDANKPKINSKFQELLTLLGGQLPEWEALADSQIEGVPVPDRNYLISNIADLQSLLINSEFTSTDAKAIKISDAFSRILFKFGTKYEDLTLHKPFVKDLEFGPSVSVLEHPDFPDKYVRSLSLDSLFALNREYAKTKNLSTCFEMVKQGEAELQSAALLGGFEIAHHHTFISEKVQRLMVYTVVDKIEGENLLETLSGRGQFLQEHNIDQRLFLEKATELLSGVLDYFKQRWEERSRVNWDFKAQQFLISTDEKQGFKFVLVDLDPIATKVEDVAILDKTMFYGFIRAVEDAALLIEDQSPLLKKLKSIRSQFSSLFKPPT